MFTSSARIPLKTTGRVYLKSPINEKFKIAISHSSHFTIVAFNISESYFYYFNCSFICHSTPIPNYKCAIFKNLSYICFILQNGFYAWIKLRSNLKAEWVILLPTNGVTIILEDITAKVVPRSFQIFAKSEL